jgi:uncharacterized RDD family membrane protein YckC
MDKSTDPLNTEQFNPDHLSPDQVSIDTPELIAISLPVAGIGSRFVAVLVDHLIWGAAFLVLFLLSLVILPLTHLLGGLSPAWWMGFFFLALFLIQWGYFALFEAFWNGRTPGKRAARIRVIHRSGRAISFMEALARNLVRIVDYMPGFYAVGVIAIFVSRQHQRLGDLAAGTLVVRDREIETPHWGESGSRTFTAAAFEASAPPPLVFTAPHLSVSLSTAALDKLAGVDLEVLEGFFSRRLDMDLTTRAALAERIAAALRAKSGLEFPAGVSVETFLEAVAHQLREVSRLR